MPPFRFMAVLLFLAVPGLAGCTAPPRLARVPGTSFAEVPPGQAWTVSVSGCARQAACDDIRGALVGELLGRGLASRVTQQPGAALSLAVSVQSERPADLAQRALAGATAGGARRVALVTVSDLRRIPAAPLRRYTATSPSVVHPFEREAGLQDGYTAFAGDIADGLQP